MTPTLKRTDVWTAIFAGLTLLLLVAAIAISALYVFVEYGTDMDYVKEVVTRNEAQIDQVAERTARIEGHLAAQDDNYTMGRADFTRTAQGGPESAQDARKGPSPSLPLHLEGPPLSGGVLSGPGRQ